MGTQFCRVWAVKVLHAERAKREDEEVRHDLAALPADKKLLFQTSVAQFGALLVNG